jgi:hypothetical protein
MAVAGQPTRQPLQRRQVGAVISMPTGVYDLSTDLVTNLAGEELAAHVSGFVLAEHAGKPVTDTVRALLPRRPRWIPRFLWRRIPTVSAAWTLSAEPLWTYPQSSAVLPPLGPGTSAVDVTTTRIVDGVRGAQVPDWRVAR